MDGLWRAEARDTVQCKMKRGGWDSTSNLSCHCISPSDDFPSLITVLFSPGLRPALKLLSRQLLQDAGRICEQPDECNSHF